MIHGPMARAHFYPLGREEKKPVIIMPDRGATNLALMQKKQERSQCGMGDAIRMQIFHAHTTHEANQRSFTRPFKNGVERVHAPKGLACQREDDRKGLRKKRGKPSLLYPFRFMVPFVMPMR